MTPSSREARRHGADAVLLSDLGRAALAYATRWGWRVLPLRARGKEPDGHLVAHGYLDATSDARLLGRWWQAVPRANVGIACAPSGLLVVDVDPRNGGDEQLAVAVRALGELPSTWTVLTPGGGAHYYFRCEESRDIGALGSGIDLKHHGYVVAPPSLHPNGGRYRWDLGTHPLEVPLASLPAAWWKRLARGSARAPSSDAKVRGVDAHDSFLGAAFEAVGWLGPSARDGRRCARCPWHTSHTDGRGRGEDSSTVLFPPSLGSTLGWFHCAHAHCEARRVVEVLRALPPHAIEVAARAFPAAYRAVLRRLASSRGGCRVD